jgi:hypothetical protein
MDVRDRKRVLGWATAATALSGVVVLAAGLLTPMQAVVDVAGARPSVAAATPASGPGERPKAPGVAGLTLEELQSLCAMDVRKPLFDAPPGSAAQGPAKPTANALSVRLLGTVDEPGHSMAILQGANGEIEVCGEGQKTDDASGGVTVLRIDHQKVTVTQGAQSYELVVPPLPTLATPEASEP